MPVAEEMTLLSRIIKSPNANQLTENKKIDIQRIEKFLHLTEDISPHLVTESAKAQANALMEGAKSAYEMAQQNIRQEQEEHEALLKKMKVEFDEELVRERQVIKEQAYHEGFAAGSEAGKKSWEGTMEEARHTVDLAKRDYILQLERSEPAIIELAVKMARKLVSELLKEDSGAWIHMVKDLVKEVREYPEIRLFIHPDWYETTMTAKHELEHVLTHSSVLYIYPDERQKVNSCTVEFPFGKIDAGLDSQLNELKEKLLESLGDSRS